MEEIGRQSPLERPDPSCRGREVHGAKVQLSSALDEPAAARGTGTCALGQQLRIAAGMDQQQSARQVSPAHCLKTTVPRHADPSPNLALNPWCRGGGPFLFPLVFPCLVPGSHLPL